MGRDPCRWVALPATDEMVSILAEVGTAFAERNRERLRLVAYVIDRLPLVAIAASAICACQWASISLP